MSTISQWSKPAVLLLLGFTLAESLTATASIAVGVEQAEFMSPFVPAQENLEINTQRNRLTHEYLAFTPKLQRFALGNRQKGIGKNLLVHGFEDSTLYAITAQSAVSSRIWLESFNHYTPLSQETLPGNRIGRNMERGSNLTMSLLLTQGLSGQCRAAARSIFIYAERLTDNPIRALQADEQVTLAEDSGRNGWIAIRSPISGFVQAKDLKPCAGNPAATTPSPTPPNRCRRVIYEEDEGLAIRENPNTNSARVGGVFLGDRVTLSDPPQFRLDDAGREWVRIIVPTSGWISNGFPQLGDINLKACF